MATAKKSVPEKAVKKSAKPTKASADNTGELVDGKRRVALSNLNKIYFPEDNITKGDVIGYYQSVADYILPYLKDRPQSLKRNPNGIHDAGFFHKDAAENAPSWMKSYTVYSESSNKDVDYIVCNDKATLAYMNNLGCIEINPWNSTMKKPAKPDYMIIDIDPSDKNTFDQVVETALAFKTLLDKARAKSFCKTSGSTGLHIYVPMGKKYDYDKVKDFAHFLAEQVNQQLPDFTTLERSLKKRGNKKIYLDYLQNRKGQTIASAYSLRPKVGATVSTPLQWKEVKPGLKLSAFTITTILPRLKKVKDLFTGIFGPGIDIKECMRLLS